MTIIRRARDRRARRPDRWCPAPIGVAPLMHRLSQAGGQYKNPRETLQVGDSAPKIRVMRSKMLCSPRSLGDSLLCTMPERQPRRKVRKPRTTSPRLWPNLRSGPLPQPIQTPGPESLPVAFSCVPSRRHARTWANSRERDWGDPGGHFHTYCLITAPGRAAAGREISSPNQVSKRTNCRPWQGWKSSTPIVTSNEWNRPVSLGHRLLPILVQSPLLDPLLATHKNTERVIDVPWPNALISCTNPLRHLDPRDLPEWEPDRPMFRQVLGPGPS